MGDKTRKSLFRTAESNSSQSTASFFKAVSQYLGLAVAIVSILVLLSWILDIPFLSSFSANIVAIKFNTALCFLLVGLSLWFLRIETPLSPGQRIQRYVAYALALIVLLAGLLTLAEYLSGLDLGIDQLLFKEPPGVFGTTHPGRMAPNTALNFVLAGIALLLMDVEFKNGHRPDQYIIPLAGLISLQVLIGYIYGAPEFLGLAQYTVMALYTGIIFFLVFIGVLLARSNRGYMAILTGNYPGSRMLLLLLPVMVIVLVLSGWLELLGEKEGDYSVQLGHGLFILFNTVVFTFILLAISPLLYRSHMRQMQVEEEIRNLNIGLERKVVERTSELQAANEALRQAEERYRLLVENAGEAISVAQDGMVKFANSKAEELTGYSIEELTSMPSIELIHPDDREMVMKYHSLRLKGNEVPNLYSFRMIDKKGNVKWLERNVTQITWEGRPAALVFDTDITERKQGEKAIRESEQKFIKVFNTNPDMIAITTIDDGRIIDTNEACLQTLGYTRDEIIGRTTNELKMWVDAKDRDRYVSMLREKGRVVDMEVSVRTKKGKIKTALACAEFIELYGKQYILSFLRDITERKRLEAERKEMEQKTQITSRLASVGEMAAGIAHEINNPLTGVIGYAELLQAHEDIPPHVKKDLETIHQGAQRVADIVKRLLTFARQSKPMRDYVIIHELIQNTLELRAYQLRTGNIQVTTEFDPNLPITVSDAGQLQQVFLNILVNAETEMKLAHGKGKLLIKTEKVGNNILISFKDDGPGIAKENLKRIFDPFFTTREVGQGTGLGLSVCHGIVAEHGGRIWAESEKGKGATFFVELPIITKIEQLKMAEPDSEETGAVNKARILVVDDEEVVRSFLNRVLTEEGHQVDTMDNAEDALEKIKTERYRLILLDIKMPGMNGMELYQRIKKIARSLIQRVVFVTGDVMGADTEAFLAKTKAPYITKPFDARQLKKELKRLLS